MDLKQLVDGTLTPAYVTSASSEIVAWNAAAEGLLGRRPSEVIGRPCFEIVGGTDLFGNRFCCEGCPVQQMVARGEPVNGFELYVRQAAGKRIRVRLLVVALSGSSTSDGGILHLMEAAAEASCVGDAGCDGAGDEAELAEQRPLTPRELQILRLLAEGRTTAEIANLLYICSKTVRNHVQNLLPKLSAHSRLEAVAAARRRDLL